MIAPGMIFILLFNIIPLAGLIMAFQNFLPAKGLLGSKWVGLDNFKFMADICKYSGYCCFQNDIKSAGPSGFRIDAECNPM